MKKVFLLLSLLSISFAFQSCEKDAVIENANNITNEQIAPNIKQATPQQILSFIATMGVELEAGQRYIVTYMSGCLHKIERNILWGAYVYTDIDCRPGCPICEIKSIREVGGNVIFGGKGFDEQLFCINPDGKIGLNVSDFHVPDFFDGALVCFDAGQISDKKVLCFMIDITKISEFTDLYQSDKYVVETPFALEAEFAYKLGVLPKNQCIPSGEYQLYSYGDIKFWYIELDEWI